MFEIREGMAVYEVDGRRLGAVRTVFLGSRSGAGGAAATPPDAVMDADSGLDDPVVALARDRLPQEIQAFLRQGGFIHIDTAGICYVDCYAIPEQIASVNDGRVTLTVSRDELLAARSPWRS
jgi:hypothetical protein